MQFTICNYFSFALVDAWMSGSNVIEFTSYEKQMLDITNNKSIFPEFVDYFIDIKEEKTLHNLLQKDIKVKKRNFSYNNNDFKKKLFNQIIN